MTVPSLTQRDLINIIKENGWIISNSNFWDGYDRIIFEKDGAIFTFQCKEKYFYLEVVAICKLLDIMPPEDHYHAYYRHLKMDEDVCYCKEGQKEQIKFKDCHGKID